jgi:PPOX class probable F420-dependent enzyme
LNAAALSSVQSGFVHANRVARLTSADAQGCPHVVPVCFALDDVEIYITIDQKPKRGTSSNLKRIRNILANPNVAIVVDHYCEDWSRLGWVMLRGIAEILSAGDEHDRAQWLLKERYHQYQTMQLKQLPVIAVRLTKVTSWGNLETRLDEGVT